MPRLVENSIVVIRVVSIVFRGNHHFKAPLGQRHSYSLLSIVSLDRARIASASTAAAVTPRLPQVSWSDRPSKKTEGTTQGIYQGMDFLTQSSSATTDIFVFGTPNFGFGTILVSAHHRCIDSCILVVCLTAKCLENPLPQPCLRPAAKRSVNDPKISKAFGEVSRGNSSSKAIQYRFDE